MPDSKPAESPEPVREGLGDPLYEPKPKENAKVDIVFVHGLSGDRVDTWTWKNEYRSQFWPKTLLPKDCPTARILSFGYNSDFAYFYPPVNAKGISTDLTIDNYSASLLHALIGLRGQTNTTDRPIIFVAHSLGGLVVANALSKPHGTDEAAKEIADRTIGTLFLGTPFHGSSKAKYGSLAISILKYFMPAAGQNIKDLQERSAKLASINDAFAKFLKERDRSRTKPFLEVACFFEDESLYNAMGKIGKIVPKESASWLGVDALSISQDHIAMCKFRDEESADYKNVVGKLCQWIKDIDKAQELSGVKGLNAQSVVVNQGPVDNRNITNHGGPIAGNLYGTASNANKLIGTINYNGVKPSGSPE